MWQSPLLNQIVAQIISFKPVNKIILYGSRAEGNFKETSDIDLAIFGKNWNDTDINLMKNKLEEEISTPLKFDLIHFEHIQKTSLRKMILQKGKTLYESTQD